MKVLQWKKTKTKNWKGRVRIHIAPSVLFSLFLFFFNLELVVKQEKSIESVCCVLAY